MKRKSALFFALNSPCVQCVRACAVSGKPKPQFFLFHAVYEKRSFWWYGIAKEATEKGKFEETIRKLETLGNKENVG